jgi:hypothetical protein
VKEEVGLDIEIAGDLGTYTVSSGFEITCFTATSASAELDVDPGEILEAGWFTLHEGLGLDLAPTALEALERYASMSDYDSRS